MRPSNRPVHRIVRQIVLLLALCSLTSIQASTVLQMSFGEVVNTAQLVFEGRVTSREARRVSDGSIHTFVTFQISEIVKGTYSGETIELRFLGGQVGTRGLQVSDMQIPELGETGIYFVESLQDFQVNPLVGWAQGHYLIEEIAQGVKVVTTASHEPIASIDPSDNAATVAPTERFSKGLASGLSVSRGIVSNATYGVSAAQFKASVRSIAEQAQ